MAYWEVVWAGKEGQRKLYSSNVGLRLRELQSSGTMIYDHDCRLLCWFLLPSRQPCPLPAHQWNCDWMKPSKLLGTIPFSSSQTTNILAAFVGKTAEKICILYEFLSIFLVRLIYFKRFGCLTSLKQRYFQQSFKKEGGGEGLKLGIYESNVFVNKANIR